MINPEHLPDVFQQAWNLLHSRMPVLQVSRHTGVPFNVLNNLLEQVKVARLITLPQLKSISPNFAF
jgi:hypothetical protein